MTGESDGIQHTHELLSNHQDGRGESMMDATTANVAARRLHDAALVEVGYKHATQLFRMELSDYRWIFGGLSGADAQDVSVYLAFAKQALDLLSEQGAPTGTSPAWEGARGELRGAFDGNSTNAIYAALTDITHRHGVPKQLPFDLLDGIDWWIRFGSFETYDAWAHFAAQTGGSTMHALAKIMGCDLAGFETPATQAGQAMALTQILGAAGVKRHATRHWWPIDVLSQFELTGDSIDPHAGRSPAQEHRFASMVRYLASRIELLFFEGSALARYLSFDGLRVLKSLFSVHWRLLNRIKENPIALLHSANRLPRQEWLTLRLQHWLGTEGKGNPLVTAMKAPQH